MLEQSRDATVVVADDHGLIRCGLRQVIGRLRGFRVVAEATDGVSALSVIERWMPDIAILDVVMPGRGGLDVLRIVRERKLPVAAIILTMYDDDAHVRQAIDLGASAYLLKDDIEPEIETALHAATRGETFFSPALCRRNDIVDAMVRELAAQPRSWHTLTPVERRVFALVSECRSTQEIAEELCVSPRTVDHHREHICRKLDLSGRYALLRYAMLQRAQQ